MSFQQPEREKKLHPLLSVSHKTGGELSLLQGLLAAKWHG
jgi:hypothetical protein